jgi:DHA1 family bicyclomycin/chloramphenicol resistance-like MFS transporter
MSYADRVRFLDRATPPHVATLILMAGLPALTMTVFLPSLPGMTAWFDTDYRLMQLSVAVYLGVNAVLQIVIGPLSDKFGRRPVVLGGVGLFCLATLGCLLAPDIGTFLFFRMCQAVVIVAMVLSRAIVRDCVPQDQAASMIGYVTMGMAVVPMIGPAIGGALDAVAGWQASFWMLLAMGLMLLWLCWADQGETIQPSGLTLGQQFREYPELLRSPRFWGYALAAAFSSGAFFSYLGGAPYVGSEVFGMDPATLGIFFGAPAIGYFCGNWFTGRFAARVGVNRMVLMGSIIVSVGMALALIVFAAGFKTAFAFFGFMTFVGLGNGMVIPNATAGMLSVRPRLAGTASGLGGAIMIGGGAAMSAYAGAILGPETGAFPLLWLMLVNGLLGVAAISVVIRREGQLRRMGAA